MRRELRRQVADPLDHISQAYNVTSAMTKGNEKDETLFSHMTLKPMTPEQLFDSLLTATAAHKAGGGEPRRQEARRLAQTVRLRLRATTRGRRARASRGRFPRP